MADKPVYVGVYTHRHGVDVALYETKQAAWEGCARVADDFWDESVSRWRDEPLKRPKDRDELCRRYFEEVEDESFEVLERKVARDTTGAAERTVHRIKVTVEYTMDVAADFVTEAQELARKEVEFMADLSHFPYTIVEVD